MNSTAIKVLIPLGILVLAIAITIALFGSRKPPEQVVIEPKAYLVETLEVNKQDLNFIVASQGSVVAKTETVLSVQVTGMVVEVADVFIEGGMFEKGQTLIELEQADYLTDLKSAEAELARAQAAFQEEQARGKVAEQEWRSVKGTDAPELGLRKPQLAQELSNVRAAEAQVERAKRNLQRTVIKAPYDGIVAERKVDLGQFLTVGNQVGTIFSTDVAEIRMPLSDSDLAYLALPNTGKSNNLVTLTASVAGEVVNWQGVLTRNEGVLDTQGRVIYAVAEVEDPYRRQSDSDLPQLKFGRFVTTRIVGNRGQGIVVLPREIVRLDGSVLVVSAQRTIEIRPVDIQRADDKHVYIRSGLSTGELVVSSTVPNPYNGMQVRLAGEEPVLPAKDKVKDTSVIGAVASGGKS